MKWFVLILAFCVGRSVSDVTNSYVETGSCLCVVGRNVNVRQAACGDRTIGSVNNGQCFTYRGSNQWCRLNGSRYKFFSINYRDQTGWVAGNFLDLVSSSRCAASSTINNAPAINAYSSTGTAVGYTCSIRNPGGRVHEAVNPTSYDCRDCNGGNTCKGGQCVALVKCSCTRNGRSPPITGCWRPGRPVKDSNGRCDRTIPRNTAIATFPDGDNYYGHAAIFIECSDDYTIRVYDQGCSMSIGIHTYSSSNRFFNQFHVITKSESAQCIEPTSSSCRWENAGSTNCPAAVTSRTCPRR